jgi:type IV pilus secretin PilQ/predicted competence protein
MKTAPKILGLFLIAGLAVYSGPVKFGDAATSGDAPADTKPAPQGGVSVTNNQVTVSENGAVEIHVNDANLLEVLRMLSLQSRKNIIASKDVTGSVTANLYNVTVPEALDAILQSNGYVYREKGNFIYIYTARELAELEGATKTTRIFPLNYIAASDAMALVKPVLSTSGTITASAAASKTLNVSSSITSAGSSSSSGGEAGGNSYAGRELVIVTDNAARMQTVEGLIKEIDRRPQQILIEATILAVTLNDNNSLGVDFSLMGGVKFGQFALAPSAVVQSAGAGTLINPQTHTGEHSYGIGSTSFPNPTSGNGLNIGFLSNNVSVFVNALESVSNTTILANPKILTLDRQQASVHAGNTLYYQNSTTATQTASIQSAQSFDTGTILNVRPFVGSDGFIRMDIHPEDSTGSLGANGLPQKSVTEVTSNVMVKDGQTVVIGGLFREASERDRSQVPGLGSIPFLGVLFRQQADSTVRQEIVVLITPHIISDESAYAHLSEAQMQRIDTLRVGARKGMMFFGRERLAEAAYENAVAELNKPHPNKNLVLWHLDMATNLNPTFLEAIELKQKVSGKRLTDSDNSIIRNFVSSDLLSSTGGGIGVGVGGPQATLDTGDMPAARK